MELNKRNIKDNSKPDRIYLFSGLMKCPGCGRIMGGNKHDHKKKNGKRYEYKKYRCTRYVTEGLCDYNKTPFENRLEKILLENIEQYLADAKSEQERADESKDSKTYKYNIDDINGEIDRLNYSWRKGKIRSVEQYEKDHDELMEKLRLAEAERDTVVVKDFSHIEAILHKGWKEVYLQLDEEHKRAFWRSIIKSFEPDWDTDEKGIKNLIFL